jgi:hypothetical protein
MTNRPALPFSASMSSIMLALLLQACAASVPGPGRGSNPVSNPPKTLRQPVRRAPRDPQLKMVPGLEGVIGATAAQLTRQFGKARLDVQEGDVRKLQFTGTPCILDIYLYPTSHSREPIATYVDARRSSDAAAVDRASCVKALKSR